MSLDEFSTNRYSIETSKISLNSPLAVRHPELCFNDGNLSIVAGSYYFLVHQGLISRHSPPLSEAIKLSEGKQRYIENKPVLELDDTPSDVHYFLLALYDGISALKYDMSDFSVVSAILSLSTKYQVKHIRDDVIRGMSSFWPRTLAHWEIREAHATSSAGVYKPRLTISHPIPIINLARAVGAFELLPSAFYDISRCTASDIVKGYISSKSNESHNLSDQDLMNVLKGKEHASRFLSTFIVNEMEGRTPAAGCIYRQESEPARRRVCQAAFEAITFEILRDVNGVVCHRSSDPLFAIVDAELMQTRDGPSERPGSAFRACEPCRLEFSVTVDTAREDLWHKLPLWFGVEIDNWP